MNTETKEEAGMNFGAAEITLSFLVAHLNSYDQEQFIRAMDRECFGIAEEGTYTSMSPPCLAKTIPWTATFTFQSLPDKKEEIGLAVAYAIGDALDIARKYKARLLSAGHCVKEDAA